MFFKTQGRFSVISSKGEVNHLLLCKILQYSRQVC